MAQSLSRVHGEVRVEDDVALAYGELVAESVLAKTDGRFVLGCSGGTSGAEVLAAAVATGRVDWSRVVLVFADERCVAPDSPDANEASISGALGVHRAELASFHPMRCSSGAAAYETLLAEIGPIDLLQLGMGADGHTASLFPGSPGLAAPPGTLVVANHDPLGNNPYDRLSLTFEAISQAHLTVFTITGANKADAFARVAAGEDLPAARVRSHRLVWLLDPHAARRAR